MHTNSRAIPVGVYGASGTSGTELVSLLEVHPCFSVAFATSRGAAGQLLTELDPAAPRVELVDPGEADPSSVELVFTCLPHGASAPIVAEVRRQGARVVDLSGDFRLTEPAVHDRVYGSERDTELASEAVYGLNERCRDQLADADVVANPGCYPTCAALGLAPLVERGWVKGPIIIDAKSGVSGAGRAPKRGTLFVSVADDVKPYKLGRAHRHVAELEQTLQRVSPGDEAPSVIFNPHVVPVERGMLATMVVRLEGASAAQARAALHEAYADEPLIEVLADGPARMRAVRRKPGAQLGITDVPDTDHVVVTSAIDNLGKGAAAQAVQNANSMFGLPSTLGLVATPGAFA